MLRFIVVLSALLVSGAVAAETEDRTVKANTRSAIGGFFSYEVDTCYPSVIPDVKVRQQPANGAVQIIPYETVLGKESRCPGTKVKGLAYVYTPKKGFTGRDEVTIDVPWASNDVNLPTIRSYTFRIEVR